MSDGEMRYGLRVRMPDNDPLSAAHLLGESWNTEKWFETEEDRDRAQRMMEEQPPYYRKGDTPSVIIEKIDRQ